uniref:Uncharacterized protein n=1 Tax=Hyaloperonospora arabidopsidis (strain Emoy2) TaxID=559515 RepID=M4BZP5_HYAAE
MGIVSESAPNNLRFAEHVSKKVPMKAEKIAATTTTTIIKSRKSPFPCLWKYRNSLPVPVSVPSTVVASSDTAAVIDTSTTSLQQGRTVCEHVASVDFT